MSSRNFFDDDFSVFTSSHSIYLDCIETYSLEEILEEPNIDIRKKALKMYRRYLDGIDRNIVFMTILNSLKGASMQKIEEELEYHINQNGEAAIVYGTPKEHITKKHIMCELSMIPIYAGSAYCVFRPLLVYSTGRKYVLKRSIKASTYFHDFFPTNIKEFEELNYKLENPFSGEALSDINGIDYYAVSQIVGEGLQLKELKSKYENQKVRRTLKRVEQKEKEKKNKKILQKKLEYVESHHIILK